MVEGSACAATPPGGGLARVRAHFEAIPYLKSLGARMIAVAPGRCALRLGFRPEFAQQHGFFHGGLIGTLADSAAGHAALTLLPEPAGTITVEFKLNFVAPGRGEALLAEAEVLKGGRSLTVSRVDVFAIAAGRRELAATALVTYLNLDEPGSRAPFTRRPGERRGA